MSSPAAVVEERRWTSWIERSCRHLRCLPLLTRYIGRLLHLRVLAEFIEVHLTRRPRQPPIHSAMSSTQPPNPPPEQNNTGGDDKKPEEQASSSTGSITDAPMDTTPDQPPEETWEDIPEDIMGLSSDEITTRTRLIDNDLRVRSLSFP